INPVWNARTTIPDSSSFVFPLAPNAPLPVIMSNMIFTAKFFPVMVPSRDLRLLSVRLAERMGGNYKQRRIFLDDIVVRAEPLHEPGTLASNRRSLPRRPGARTGRATSLPGGCLPK